MGRTSSISTDSSPEESVEIKVHPRRSDPYPSVGGGDVSGGSRTNHGGSHHHRHHQPHYPPPRPRRLFKKWFPWLVPSIIVANIVLFVIAMFINNCPAKSEKCIGTSTLGRFAFQPTKENPLLGPTASTLLKMGAMEVKKVVNEHEIWRLVSCMWLHAGVFHVLANMLSLVFVGIRLEQEFGFVRIGLLYLLAGIGGSLLSSLFVRTTISVGASGALFGLLGAMLSELLTNWTIYENKLQALLTLLIIIAINLAVGILPHVDNFAHLGGFVTGFLLGFVLLVRPQFSWVNQKHVPPGYIAPQAKSKYKPYQFVCLIIALVLLVAGFAAGFASLLRGVDGNEHCSWCHYLSCVPTPFWNCGETRCSSSQLGDQLTLTCLTNNKTQFYVLEPGSDTAKLQELCIDLCK